MLVYTQSLAYMWLTGEGFVFSSAVVCSESAWRFSGVYESLPSSGITPTFFLPGQNDGSNLQRRHICTIHAHLPFTLSSQSKNSSCLSKKPAISFRHHFSLRPGSDPAGHPGLAAGTAWPCALAKAGTLAFDFWLQAFIQHYTTRLWRYPDHNVFISCRSRTVISMQACPESSG